MAHMNDEYGTLKVGDRIEVYRNLHKNCFSIRRNGRVVAHKYYDQPFFVRDATFVVRPAGRAKVLKEQRKNVHAFVRGYYQGETANCCGKCFSEVSYNPYKNDSFYTLGNDGNVGQDVKTANLVLFENDTLWAK